jgi:hypothetical protein
MPDRARPFLRIFNGGWLAAPCVRGGVANEVPGSGLKSRTPGGPPGLRDDQDVAAACLVPVRSGASVKVRDSETMSRIPDIGPGSTPGIVALMVDLVGTNQVRCAHGSLSALCGGANQQFSSSGDAADDEVATGRSGWPPDFSQSSSDFLSSARLRVAQVSQSHRDRSLPKFKV